MSTSLISVLTLVWVFCYVALRRAKIFVHEDGIRIKDCLYPLFISNDTIVSISLLNNMPKLLLRNNGSSFGKIYKGYYKVKKDDGSKEKATLYLQNYKNQVIEIKTVNDLIYINCQNNDLTKELFDEMNKTVRRVKDYELNHLAKHSRSSKSIWILIVFIGIFFISSFLTDYTNKITVENGIIEINGEYSMDIHISDIDTIMLTDEHPSIKLRTNGISTRKVNIGNFKMEDGNKCRLYINKSTQSCIEIRLSEHISHTKIIFLNRKTNDETKNLFDKIYNLKY